MTKQLKNNLYAFFTRAPSRGVVLSTLLVLLVIGCGGRGEPSIKAKPQSISFAAIPSPILGGTVTVIASATSGLAINYSTATPTICSVNSGTGLVTNIALGTCVIAANQSGNTEFAPAAQTNQSITFSFDPSQTISFSTTPTLTLFGTATVAATASSGLAVSYSTSTPAVCSVDSGTGVVTNFASGSCIITANQVGDTHYSAAPQVTQTLTVASWVGAITVPSAPSDVAATLESTPSSVSVSFTAPTSSGGSPLTGYTVSSNPAGITTSGTASPITVNCLSTCKGYSFSLTASNASGNSVPSSYAEILTSFNVIETFREPDTQPRDSIFIGTFTLNSTTGTVSNLRGILSESMTGSLIGYPNDTMTWLPLNHQLSAVSDDENGLLVTTFMLNTTNTLSNNPTFGGTDGWSPGTGLGLYYGFPAINPGNAYARIYVNLENPTATLTQAQIAKLAYADCAPGGMMGDTCMTGHSGIGSMGGYPLSQIITKK